MAEYEVKLPITGFIYTMVEAESEEEAIKKAICEGNYTFNDIEEWDVREKVIEGNFWHGVGSPRASATEVSE